jgi:hypothetical protein
MVVATEPIRVMDLVRLRLGLSDAVVEISGSMAADAGFPLIGGCEICHATVSIGNAYPSHSGYWRCRECIGDTGWDSLEDAASDLWGWPTKREQHDLDAQHDAIRDAERDHYRDTEAELAEEEPESQPRAH